MSTVSTEKLCEGCNKPIDALRKRWPHAKFCSVPCRSEFYKKHFTYRSAYSHLSGGTVGALHELMVTCDLLKRGYHVFRAVSQSCDCDLAILKNRKLIRVEVTTGYKNKNGTIGYPRHKAERYDLLAVVTVDGIHYSPHDLLEAL